MFEIKQTDKKPWGSFEPRIKEVLMALNAGKNYTEIAAMLSTELKVVSSASAKGFVLRRFHNLKFRPSDFRKEYVPLIESGKGFPLTVRIINRRHGINMKRTSLEYDYKNHVLT